MPSRIRSIAPSLRAPARLYDVAEMLYGLVFLQAGFSASGLAMQRDVAARAPLWSGLELAASQDVGRAFSVDLAVKELAGLMRLRPVLAAPSYELSNNTPATLFKVAERRPGSDAPLIALGERVGERLRSVPRLGVEGGLGDMLKGLLDDVMTIPPIHLHEHLGVDTAAFAALYGLDRLRQFLLRTGDLLNVLPSGSGLFDATARLDPAALGPYFSNLRYVIRGARDIFALVEVASGGARPDEIECWCVLMSGFLSGGQTLDLVDELGDRGMGRALSTLLARSARSSALHHPFDIVWRIRDAGLDMGDLKLAEHAQQLVALWTPTKVTEWVVLGDIRATGADAAGAEAAYGQGLLLQPDDGSIQDRLSMLRSGNPSPVRQGYGTSPGRLRLRRARLAAYTALREQRIT